MIWEILKLVFSVMLLWLCSKWFIESSARFAKRIGVSELIIGLTIVAVGTSIPNLAAGVISVLNADSEFLLGNIFGGSIATICLCLGVPALFSKIKTNSVELKRDSYFLILFAGLFMLMASRGFMDYVSGGVLLVVYVLYTIFLIKTRKKNGGGYLDEFMDYFFGFKYLLTAKKVHKEIFTKKKIKAREKVSTKYAESRQSAEELKFSLKELILKDILVMVLSTAGIILGGQLLIDGAEWAANIFGIAESFVGMTIVGISLTIPEIFVSINTIRKKYYSLLVGNVIGSCTINLLLVGGFSLLFQTKTLIPEAMIIVTIPFFFVLTILTSVFIKTGWKVDKKEGITLLAAYITILAFNYFF